MTDICTGCHARPRPDEAFICQECGDQWHGDLQAVPGWLDELRVEAMKLSRKTASTGRGSAEPSSPVDWTASRCADEIRWHLVTAIQALTLGQTPAIPDTTDAMVDWLLANEDRLPFREQAGDLTAGLHALIQRAANALGNRIDRQSQLVVLLLEHQVQGPKHGTGDIPVEVMGFQIAYISVRQQTRKSVDDGLAILFTDTDIDCHEVPLSIRLDDQAGP